MRNSTPTYYYNKYNQKKKKMKRQLTLGLFAFAAMSLSAQTFPYQDKSLSFHERAIDLVKRFKSLNDKVYQMGTNAPAWTTKDGVSIPSYQYWNEALHGVARQNQATSFPESKAMSSTWDPQLIFDCASATSDEARIKHIKNNRGLNYWCPTINMSRDPRWGRDEEDYGEDPFLTGTLTVQYVKGMQGEQTAANPFYKTVATVKHFACNNYEKGRHNTSSNVTERMLREYYLPAFEMAVKQANVRSVMAAYNAVNGVPCPANHLLLTDILRTEWGFNGFVTSDCAAVEDIYNKHRYLSCTPAQAAAWAIKAGCDINCNSSSGTACYQTSGEEAVANGYCTEADIDSALVRIFEARISMGEFDDNVEWDNLAKSLTLESDANVALALKAEQEAIVLLKNDGILPLSKDKKVALIGPYSQAIQLGGYSGSPTKTIAPLAAIANKIGYDVNESRIQATSYDATSSKVSSKANQGTNLGNLEEGHYACYKDVDFGTGKTKMEINMGSRYTCRYAEIRLGSSTGTLIGRLDFPAMGNWTSYETDTIDIAETTGKQDVYFVFHKTSDDTSGNKYIGNITWFRFFNNGDLAYPDGGSFYCADGCSVSGERDDKMVAEALHYAEQADVVLFFGGTDLNVSDESRDRTTLDLPGYQQQLLEQLYAKNKNTILVMESCSSHTINWAKENLPAIVEAWYGGQQQGQAIADVLYGDVNPSGKLTTTWYNSLSDLPSDMLTYNIDEGKYTYMYYDKTPLFPFGYGLSYTNYEYSNMAVDAEKLTNDKPVTVTATVSNTGKVDGDEIVQLYAVYNDSKVSRPKKQLVGFQRVSVKAGQTATVSIPVTLEQLAYYDENSHNFLAEEGSVTLQLAASSADVRAEKTISTEAAVVKTTFLSDASAVTSVEADQLVPSDIIYSLTGTPLCSASEFNSLPRGIYILNGLKYFRK